MELGKADPSLLTKLRMYTLWAVCVFARVCRGQGLIVFSLWMRKLKFKNLDALSMVLQLLWSVVVKFMDSAARLQRFEPALC